jgi:two-component system sensor histidine kinase/response regulator
VSEAQIVLSFTLATLVTLAIGSLALFAVAHAKNRIILEQRRALETEQRLRRAQEAFSDNAHHELKTPLQILSSHLHMLGLTNLDAEQAELLSRADGASRRLQSLVQDLLDLTALHQGSLRIRPSLEDLESHLRILVADYEVQATAKGLAFHAEQGSLPAPVVCDSSHLSRALSALLENAVRFTEAGSVRVRWTARSEAGFCRLRVEVEDTGLGLPADWSRLLQPFEQGEVHPHRVQKGLGLGLPLAAGLLKAMGGQLGLAPRSTGTLAWAEILLEEGEAEA